MLVRTLAKEVPALNEHVAELDKAIEAPFRDRHTFDVITSMPGLGIIPGAEFLAATGGDKVCGTADHLAGFGGVAPAPWRPGAQGRSGNLRRPQLYKRRLQRVLHTSAFNIRRCDESRRFYDRKRAEGRRHTQAVLALARRRVNVLCVLQRDGRWYELAPPTPHDCMRNQ